MTKLIIFLFCINLSCFAAAPKLTPDTYKTLEKGELIILKKKIEGKAWPELSVYTLINATPLESVAIFAAYDYQKDYVPNLIKSIPKTKSPMNVEVDYEMDLPWPLGTSKYIHGHFLEKPDKHTYKVRWYMIKSDSAEKVRGFATFHPYGNKTLMEYVSFVDPKSILAGVFKKLMVSDVKKTIHAIIDTIADLKKKNPAIISKYSKKINGALAGKVVY